jgi:nucleotide-binding universal stress UspA family protein
LCGGGAQLVCIAAGSVGAGLESVALQRSADLIVVGASRRDGVVRSLGGDDVRAVMHETPCAVAVAPVNYARDPGSITQIGVAYDGSPESDVALAQAGLLAGRLCAHLQLCHVLAPPGMLAVLVDESEIQLAAERELLPRAAGLDITHVYGLVGDELVAFGERVELTVCGSRRHGPLRRIAFGSTSDHLARHLSTPLIVAPTIDTTSIERWQRARRTGSSDRQMHEPIVQLTGGGSP